MEPPMGALRSVFLHKTQGRPGQCYDAVQKLGEGAFGVAHLVLDKRTNLLRVLKTINKRQSQVPASQLETEIRNLKACDHPHIVRLFEYYEDYENIYLVMEHAEGGELHQVLEAEKQKGLKLPERWVAMVIKQCLVAVSHVHSQGIIHKDLKSENILLLHRVDPQDPQQLPHAVIIDLGIGELFSARLGRRARCTVVAGTPTHMAPEVWRGNFGPVADVWSLGVVMFELLAGDVPFLCSSLNSAQEWLRLHRQGPNWSLLSHVSKQARSISQRMLNWDERMRPTAQQCLGHAWLKDSPADAGAAEGSAEETDAPEDSPKASEPSQTPRPSARSRPSEAGLGEIVQTLGDYVGRSRFEKAVLMQVASQCHLSQMRRIAEVFTSADRNCDGTVTREELVQALVLLGADGADAESYVACVDADGNGSIEYTELAAGCMGLLYESLRGLLWQGFCILDVDGNGVLSREEIESVLTRSELAQYGFPGGDPSESVQEALSRMDIDGDGHVSFEDLCRVFITRPPVGAQEERKGPPSRRATKPLHDEEFAQFLDQIEADHEARNSLSVGPCGANFGGSLQDGRFGVSAHPGGSSGGPPGRPLLAPATSFDGALLDGIIGDELCGLPSLPTAGDLPRPRALEPANSRRSVEEELSSLLADIGA